MACGWVGVDLNGLDMAKVIEVRSHGVCYWMRSFGLLIAIAVLYWLGFPMREYAPSAVIQMSFAMVELLGICLAYRHRPRSFRLWLEDDQLVVELLSSRRVQGIFPLADLRHVTVRNAGHLMNLSVLRIVVQSKGGAWQFGPIYLNGVDTVTSGEVARLLPRIARPELPGERESESS